MKNFLFSLLAVATLIGCGKNDDNGSDSANLLVKKITEKDEDGNLKEVITLTYQGGRPVSFSEANYENGVQTGTTVITNISYEGNFVKRIKVENARRDNSEQNFTYKDGKVATKTEKYERDRE